MTPKQQRIAIAVACGWKPDDDGAGTGWKGSLIHRRLIGMKPTFRDGKVVSYLIEQTVPDYLNDLNAMHEAEKLLQWTGQDIKYTNYLFDAVGINRFYYTGATPEAFPADRQFAVFHANATQRAKAFLRTIDKWEESK